MAEVIVRKLNKKFDLTHVVKDVDLQIHDKEFVVFVGPSGCGKTTTLRMIAGLEAITSRRHPDRRHGGQRRAADGSRHRHGVPELRALSAHERRRQHGVRPQDAEVRESEIEARIKRAADILGIGDLLHRKPRQLSGGQRQRVALGRAIVRDPKVFLFDEPLSQPRRQAPRADAGRAQEAARAAGHHGDLRDPRPGRGDDPGRPRRRDEGRPGPAGRRAARALQHAGQPLRGRLHRLAGDELRRRHAVRRQRQGCGPRRRGSRIGLPEPVAATRSTAAMAARPRSASAPRTSISPGRPTRPNCASTSRSKWSSSSVRRSCSTRGSATPPSWRRSSRRCARGCTIA